MMKIFCENGLLQENDGMMLGVCIRVRSGADKLSTLQDPIQIFYPLEMNCDKIPVRIATTTHATNDSSKTLQGRPRRDAAVAARARILELTSRH